MEKRTLRLPGFLMLLVALAVVAAPIWYAIDLGDVENAEGRFLDGYWRSGDVGTVDSDGYLKVTDRLKDVIKSGGEWISSIDMENLLTSHPAITEAAVVGLPHPKWQERPYVQVMLRPGATITLAEVHEHLSGAFASWQLPERVDVVTELPRTSVGKIDKKALRAPYWEGKARGVN